MTHPYPFCHDYSGSDRSAGLVYQFSDEPDCATEELTEFHLVYAGEMLRAAGNKKNRMWEKHQIRRYLHAQLKNLWETHPLLSFYRQPNHMAGTKSMYSVEHHTETQPETIAARYEGFVPVVNQDFGMFCDLDILFLRAEPAGHVVKRDAGGGDIDNRMKVLFDALCIPQRGGIPPLKVGDEPDPNPMFVLLSDDSLITSIKISTDRLLVTATDDPAEACLIIRVNVKVVDSTRSPYGVVV